MAASLADLALRALKQHDGAAAGPAARVPATGCDGVEPGALEDAGWAISGMVCGAAVHHVGLVGWPTGNQEIKAVSTAMYTAREEAIGGLRDQAAALGADGVIATSLDLHFMRDDRHLPRFVAFGTAIRRRGSRSVRPPGPAAAPFVTSMSAMEFILSAAAGYHPLGIVMGSCVYHIARQEFSQWAGAQRQNVEMATYTAALYQAREIAMARLQREALRYKADGVIGVSTTERSHVWGSHVIEFFAVGTAVRADPTTPTPAQPPLVVSMNDPAVATDPGVIAHSARMTSDDPA